tara:strand:- start:510 stop:800 length:291 start_codon:yes stop_codon:yes gene_type:complete
MTKAAQKTRGKRKTRKAKVRSHYNGGYASTSHMQHGSPYVGFGGTFKQALGTSLGQIGAMKAIDTVAGLFKKKKTTRPKPRAPMLVSYDSGYYTYR